MILNMAECVITNSLEEIQTVIEILEENGFRTWWGGPLSKLYISTHFGIRWSITHEYPNCIATLSKGMVQSVVETGVINDTHGDNPHTYLTYEEFVSRACGQTCSDVSVDDLL